MSKTLCLVVMLLALPRVCQADGLELKLNIRKSLATRKNIADVLLVNTGEDRIVVLSKGLSQALSYDGTKCELCLQIPQATWNGHRIVQSKCEFAPVVLKPGDCAKYMFMAHPFPNPFKRLKSDASEIKVVYEVTAADGERYDIWHGRAVSATFKVVDGQIQR